MTGRERWGNEGKGKEWRGSRGSEGKLGYRGNETKCGKGKCGGIWVGEVGGIMWGSEGK